nr:thermospermine synthase ACAULIS5-like [Ipomoea batatas]
MQEVVDFCKSYLVVNREAFSDPRLHLVINDARPKLNQGGIFVTQAGPAGIFSHTEVFSCIYNTLKQVFKYVVPYSAHIPSYADTWGWVMASDSPFEVSVDELDRRMKQRVKGENRYLDGNTFSSASTLSKAVRISLENETHVYTEGSARSDEMRCLAAQCLFSE